MIWYHDIRDAVVSASWVSTRIPHATEEDHDAQSRQLPRRWEGAITPELTGYRYSARVTARGWPQEMGN
jgi:hypothetical protein